MGWPGKIAEICMKSAGVSIYNRREVTAIYTVVHIVDVTGRLGWPGKIAEMPSICFHQRHTM